MAINKLPEKDSGWPRFGFMVTTETLTEVRRIESIVWGQVWVSYLLTPMATSYWDWQAHQNHTAGARAKKER